MSDEELKETQEHNPQLSHRRPRGKFVADYRKLAENQAETIKQLQTQSEKLMSLITSGNVGGGNPLTMFLPVKPELIERPRGYRYILSRIKEHENDDNDTHTRDVPERPDNPNEPDPRYCAFCGKNVPEMYGHKVSGTPTLEEMQIIEQCFVLHKQDAETKSTLKGAKNSVHRRFAADHLEMTAVKGGRVPDAVANFQGREWTAAEWSERELKEWEAKCRRVGLGMARGGA